MDCKLCQSKLFFLEKNNYRSETGPIDLYYCSCCGSKYEVIKINEIKTIIKELKEQ